MTFFRKKSLTGYDYTNDTVIFGAGIATDTIRTADGATTKSTAQIPQLNTGQTWSGGINYFTSQTNITHPYLVLGSVATNASKTGNVALSHYSGNNSVTGLRATSNSTTNTLNIGGSDSGAYASQVVNIYSAPTNTTLTGSLIATIDTNGITLANGSITTTSNADLNLLPNGTGTVRVGSTGVTFSNATTGYVSGTALDYFENNIITGISFTGAFTASNKLFVFSRLGNIIMCRMPDIQASATSASNLTAAINSIPTRFRPIAQYRGWANGLDNGSNQSTPLIIDFMTNGSIVISKSAGAGAGNFTSGATCGPWGTVFMWESN